MDSGYQQEKLDAARVRFTVTPATVKISLMFKFLGAFLGGLICGGVLGVGNEFLQAVFTAIGAWLGWKLAVRILTARIEGFRSSGGTFVVSPNGLETSTGVINRDQLHRVTLKNGIPVATSTEWLWSQGPPPLMRSHTGSGPSARLPGCSARRPVGEVQLSQAV
jgi:hypothetical protein